MVYDVIKPLITVDDLYEFTARERVQIACAECETILSRTVNAIRVNLRRNNRFICHKCRVNDPAYIMAQKKSHPKTGSKWNSLVRVNCDLCGKESHIRYRSLQWLNRAHKKHTCLSCVNKRTHANGKFKSIYTKEFFERLNAAGDEFWAKNRDKWKTEYMGYLLDDPAYHVLMSECGKKPWKNDDYRKRMVKFGKEQWQDPEFRKKMVKFGKEQWQDPEYRRRVIEANRAKWQDPEFREKMAVVRSEQANNVSSLQTKLYKYLDDLGVDYRREGPETRIGYYVFDCLVDNPDGRDLLIECQGDYWHSSDGVQARDRGKFTYIDRYFPEYEIMYIWEHEFSAKDRVLQRLQLKLGISMDIIDFDFKDLVLREVSCADVREFLDAYHYIGKGRGGSCFGAFLRDELVGCVVFSSPLRQNTAGQFGLVDSDVQELSRLCIHPSYHKKNFASWLIGQTVRLIDADIIIAYADTTVGHSGTIYKAANFKLHHEVAPDYWYVDGDGYVMHKKTLYQRARKMSMRESDFAEKYGYYKKWGGKKLCFVFEKQN